MFFRSRKAPPRHFLRPGRQHFLPGLCALRIDNAPQLRYTIDIEYPGICGAEDPPQKRKKVSPLATEAKLRQLAESSCPVYYFYSSERYLKNMIY